MYLVYKLYNSASPATDESHFDTLQYIPPASLRHPSGIPFPILTAIPLYASRTFIPVLRQTIHIQDLEYLAEHRDLAVSLGILSISHQTNCGSPSRENHVGFELRPGHCCFVTCGKPKNDKSG